MPSFTYFFCWSPDGNGGFAGGCVWCKMKKMIPETPKSDPSSQVAECLEEGTPFDPSEWSVEGGCVGRSSLLLLLFWTGCSICRVERDGIADSATGAVGWQVFKHWFSRLRPYDGLTWASRVEQVFPISIRFCSTTFNSSGPRRRRLVRKSCLVSSKPKRWMRPVQLIFARRSTTASCARLSNGPALLWLGFSCCSCLSGIP